LRAVLVACFATTLIVATSACGSDGEDTVAVNEVAQKTQDAATARITGSSKIGNETVSSLTGEADLAKRRYHFQFESAGDPYAELVVIGYDGYQRGSGEGATGEWCSMGRVDGLNLDFGAVLEALRSVNGRLEELGTDSVRDVATTHYLLNSQDPAWNGTELWVDGDNRLRRLVQRASTEAGSRADSAEFYDFGADLQPITAPPASKACPNNPE
jgi:hypothetical protein